MATKNKLGFAMGMAWLLAAWPAYADNLGAIGKGLGILLVIGIGLLLSLLSIAPAIMLGRWIKKPSKVSGFILAGIGSLLALAWFLLLGVSAVSSFIDARSSQEVWAMVGWFGLGGGILSIAPAFVLIRSIKLIRILFSL